MLDRNELKERIKQLKEEKNAVIVAHNYQNDEVQEIADVIGDSLALSRYCANNDKDVIVFLRRSFYGGERKNTFAVKTVLLAEIDAGCPMADMITADALREAKKKYPGAVVVCYVNSSAEVKAESDICCTSSNALRL